MPNSDYDPNGNLRNDYQLAKEFQNAKETQAYKNRVQQEHTNRVRQQRQNLENKLVRDNPSARGQRDYRNFKNGLDNASRKVGNAFNPKPAINDIQKVSNRFGDAANRGREGLNNSRAGKIINNFGDKAAKGLGRAGDALQDFSRFKGSGSDYLDGFGNAARNNLGGFGSAADDLVSGVAGGGVASRLGGVSLGSAARFAGGVGVAIAVNTVAVALADRFQRWVFGEENDGRGNDIQRREKRGDPPFLGGQTPNSYIVQAQVSYTVYNNDGTIAGGGSGYAQGYAIGPISSIFIKQTGRFFNLAVKGNNDEFSGNQLDWSIDPFNPLRIVNIITWTNVVRLDNTTQTGDIAQGGNRTGDVIGTESIFKPTIEPKSRPDEIRNTGIAIASSPSEINKPKPRPFPPPLIIIQPQPRESDHAPVNFPVSFPPPVTTPKPVIVPVGVAVPVPDPYGVDPFPNNPVTYNPLGGGAGSPIGRGGTGSSIPGGTLQQKNVNPIPIPLEKTPKVDPFNPIDLTKKPIPEPDIPKPITQVKPEEPKIPTQTKHDPCVANNNPCASDLKDTINQGFDSLRGQKPEKTLITGKIEFDKHEKYEEEKGKYTYEFQGENIQGLSNQLEAVSKTLLIVHERMTRIELTLAQSELNHLKKGANIPELMIFWYEAVQKGAKQDKGATPYITKIPHCLPTKNPKLPKSYSKGSYYAYIFLNDGTKISINTRNANEGIRLIKELYYLVDPKYKTQNELDIKTGKRESKKLKEIIVYPSHANFYSKGYSETAQPDWTSYYWKWS